MAIDQNTAIERLELDDSQFLQGAQRAIGAMEKVATGAEKMAGTVSTGTTSAFDKLDKAVTSSQGALNRWRARADDSERSLQMLIRAENDFNRAIKAGESSVEEKTRVLDALWRQTIGAADAANQNAIAMERERQVAEAAQRSFNELLGVSTALSGSARASAAAFEEAARAEEEAALAVRRLATETEQLRAKYVPMAAQHQQYQRQVEETTRAVEIGAITQREARLALAATATANDNFAQAQSSAAGTSARFGTAIQQAGFQVGDFAVQVASGQGVLRPFIQQGTQLISMFGPWGAVIGAAGAVVGALVTYLWDFEDAAGAAEKAAGRYDDIMSAIDDSLRRATESGKALRGGLETEASTVDDLTRHYAKLSVTMREVESIRLTALGNQAREALAEQRTALAGLLDGVEDAAELSRRMSSVGGQMPLGQQPEDVLRMVEALDAFKRAAPDDVEAIGRLAVALDKVAKAGGPFADEARKAADALTDPATQAVELADKLKLVEANMAVLAGTATSSQVALLNLGDATSKTGREKAKLAKQIDDTIADLEVELKQQEKLREAHESGADAVRVVTDAQEAYQIVQRMKLDGDSDEATKIAGLVVKINDQKRAIEGITEAQKAAEEQTKKLAQEQKRAAEQAIRDYEKVMDRIRDFTEQALGDEFFKILKGETVDFAEFFETTILRTVANVLASIATQQIVLPIATQLVGGMPGLFGLSGQAAGVASSAGGLFGGSSPFSGLTNIFGGGDLFRQFAASGIGQSLGLWSSGGAAAAAAAGVTAATPAATLALTGPAGGFGAVAGLGTASTGGMVGAAGLGGQAAGLTALGAAAGPILAAGAIALPLLMGMFGGSPSVGPVGIADFSPGLGRRRAFDVEGIDPFTSDNGGNAEGLRPIAEAIADLIADSADRFSATIEESLRFRVANYQGPEGGSGRSAGFEVNAFIRGEAERRIAEGLSQEQAVFEALRFAVQEAFTFDSATLAEAAANTAAETTEDLLAALDFADGFDRLTTALDALGQGINANSLTLAQNTVAVQNAARQYIEEAAGPIVDALQTALELFPATTTRQAGGRESVRSVLVGTVGEDERYLNPGDAGYDAAIDAPGARVLDRIIGIDREVTEQAENYAANLERIRDATAIATGSVDQLIQQITGEFEPQIRGPFSIALEAGGARLDELRRYVEDVNEQIREANTNFPGLNAALIDVNQTIVDAQAALIANLQADFRQSVADALDPAAARRQAFVEGVTPQITDAVALGLGGDEPLMRDLFRAFSDGAAAAGLGIQDIVAALEELRVAAGDAGVTVTQLTSGALAELRQDFRQQLEDAANLGEARIRSLISASRSTIDDAVALGLGGDVPVLRNIVTAFVDSLGSAGTGITGIISALDDLSGEAARAGVSIAQLTAEAIGGLRDAFAGDITRQLNEATGLGAINTINDLIDTRSANAADAVALGLDANSTAGTLFDAQLRAMLSGSSLADLNAILTSGQILDEGAQAILEVVIAEQALTAVRATEVTAMQSLLAEHQRFADAANDNARTLRQAALSMLTDPNLSPLSPLARLQEAISQRDALNALANDDDPTDAESQNAISRLPDAVQRTNELARAYYASSEDYAQIFADGQDILSATALRQESIEQQQLTALQDIEQAILDLGGSISSSTPADIAAAAGFNFGNHADRNRNIYNQLVSLGLPTPSAFGGGQLNALRDGNPAVDALLQAMGFAEGGLVTGGIPGRDSVPAMLMPGERVFSVPHSRIIEQLAAANQGGGDAREFAALTASVDRLASRVDRLIAVTAESGTANMDGLAAVAVGIEEVRQAVRRAA